MNDESNNIISFAEFELDTVHRRLLQNGETVALHAKAFDLLTFLVQNNGRVVSKDYILDTVWEGSFVEESNLVVQVSNLRKALGETKNSPRFLITVPGKGYKFAAETNENSFIIETHTVSELTIEHEEEIADEPLYVPERKSSNRKRLAVAAVVGLVILTIGAFGFWRFQQTNQQKNFAFDWTNPKGNINARQLTAKGNINVAAISPDGSLYAYTNEGSELSGLWVAGINGSQEIEVIPPSPMTFKGLTFSPDGLFIYYTAYDEKNQEGSLFRVPTFGGISEKILSNIASSVSFSPDGNQVVFVRGDSTNNRTSLIVAKINDNAEEKEIASRPSEIGFNGFGGSWSPDGKKIAVGGIDESTKENVVLTFDVNTKKEVRFGEKSWNLVRRTSWLPDGSGLLVNVIEKEFWQKRQIWLLEYPSGKAHRITNDLNRYGQETLAVSNDGTKILAVNAQAYSNIFVGEANDPADLKQITNNAVGKRDGFFNGLVWTPDHKLVFMRFFDNSDSLWTMNADGTNAKQLTPSGTLDRKPTLTSDGKYVFFNSMRSGKWNVWRIGSDGKNLKQITFDTDSSITANGGSLSLTPDDKWIFYGRNGFIWKVSVDGGTPIQMTNKSSKSAEVSPDSKMFACFYHPSKEAKLKLAVFPIEGGEPLHLFDVPVDLLYEKLRWTLDNQSLVYAFYNSTAWKQNLSGGEPETFLKFPGENINAFSWSPDGEKFAVAYGKEVRDVVIFSIER